MWKRVLFNFHCAIAMLSICKITSLFTTFGFHNKKLYVNSVKFIRFSPKFRFMNFALSNLLKIHHTYIYIASITKDFFN